jgi:hypothetical protein
VTFANRFFDQVFRASAWQVTQKGIALAAQEISTVEVGKAQECGLPLAVTEVSDRGDALVVGHKERMTAVNSGPSQTPLRPYVNAAFSLDADPLSA